MRKQNYTSHYQLLSYLSSLGVKVTLVRGYAFQQTEFISGYVNFCAAQRKKSVNSSDKKLWKNMANIIYGKFIGKNHIQFFYLTKLLCRRSPKKGQRWILQLFWKNGGPPSYPRERNAKNHQQEPCSGEIWLIFHCLWKNLQVLLPMKQGLMNKPIHIGFTVLERRWNYLKFYSK